MNYFPTVCGPQPLDRDRDHHRGFDDPAAEGVFVGPDANGAKQLPGRGTQR